MVKRVKNRARHNSAPGKGGSEGSGHFEADAAHYLVDMLVLLRKIAQKEEMDFLVYLLNMACSEAAEQREMLKKKRGIPG